MTAGNHRSRGAAAGRHALVIVKLGGSLAATRTLPALLATLGEAVASGMSIVIVPGGGPFADAVRVAQSTAGFDDATAHDLALLAMAQYGRMLAALSPHELQLKRGAAAIETALVASPGAPPGVDTSSASCLPRAPLVWLPDPATDALEVERSWRVTSDSLALWLAVRLGAQRVVLVKTCATLARTDLGTLAASGVIDAAYPASAAAWPEASTRVVFDADPQALRAVLAATN